MEEREPEVHDEQCPMWGGATSGPHNLRHCTCSVSSLRERLQAAWSESNEFVFFPGEAKEMIASLDELERLKADPNWGDVKIKNYSVETPEELLAAAKRLVAQGETLGGCGTPYGKRTGFAAQFDEIAVGEAYQKQAAELATANQRLGEAVGLLRRVEHHRHCKSETAEGTSWSPRTCNCYKKEVDEFLSNFPQETSR